MGVIMVWMIFQYLGLPLKQTFSPKWSTFVYTRLNGTLKVILNVKQLGTMKKTKLYSCYLIMIKNHLKCNFCTFEFKVPTKNTDIDHWFST